MWGNIGIGIVNMHRFLEKRINYANNLYNSGTFDYEAILCDRLKCDNFLLLPMILCKSFVYFFYKNETHLLCYFLYTNIIKISMKESVLYLKPVIHSIFKKYPNFKRIA